MDHIQSRGMGWQPGLKDTRDYRPDHPVARERLERASDGRTKKRRLPTNVDLREYLPAARDQGGFNSSTAFAVLSLVEYFEARTGGRVLDGSRLFVYQMALKLLRQSGNAGVDLRTTFKALVRFGAPPEAYWPYGAERFEREPTDPFLFSFAREYERICYFRLDGRDGALQLMHGQIVSRSRLRFNVWLCRSELRFGGRRHRLSTAARCGPWWAGRAGGGI